MFNAYFVSFTNSAFRRRNNFVLAGIVTLALLNCSRVEAQTDLGLVGIKSIHNRYLQAHTDGEMHASNPKRNEEETWHLVEVDKANHVYALLNWRNHQFVSKKTNGCVPANSTTLSASEKWIMVSGKKYGVDNAVAFKSFADGTFIGANKPGKDDDCGGEVASKSADTPPVNKGDWPGWWVMEAATAPEPGKDFWTGVGKVFEGIASQITPANVAAILALIAA